MNTPTINTRRFVIRPFMESDLVTFARYRSLPEVEKYQDWSDYTYADALAFFEDSDYSRFGIVGRWYQLAVATKESNSLLGDLAVHFVDNEQVEIGFTVAPENQRNHVAKEAAAALLAYLFGTLEKHRVVATTDAKNVASYRTLESLGFRREAHFHQNIFFKGEWGDEYQYAILATEFYP